MFYVVKSVISIYFIYLCLKVFTFIIHIRMYCNVIGIYIEELTLYFNMITVTPNQIERLYSRFTSLDRGDCGTLSREDFLRIPELAINPLGDRIVNAFFEESGNDRVNFLQFMQVLAHFRPIKKNSPNRLNSRQEKLKCKGII